MTEEFKTPKLVWILLVVLVVVGVIASNRSSANEQEPDSIAEEQASATEAVGTILLEEDGTEKEQQVPLWPYGSDRDFALRNLERDLRTQGFQVVPGERHEDRWTIRRMAR